MTNSFIFCRWAIVIATDVILCILLFNVSAEAELWKCKHKDTMTETFTDTPTFSEEQTCEKVETIRYSHAEKRATPKQQRYAPPSSKKNTKDSVKKKTQVRR